MAGLAHDSHTGTRRAGLMTTRKVVGATATQRQRFDNQDSTTSQSVCVPPNGGACKGTLVAILIGMRVQIAPCDRYRLRVTTWGPFPIAGPSPRGSGAPPHA